MELYKKGVLGYHNPQSLNNSIFTTAMMFGTRGKEELYNRQLGDFKVRCSSDRFLFDQVQHYSRLLLILVNLMARNFKINHFYSLR